MTSPLQPGDSLMELVFAGRSDPARMGADLTTIARTIADVALAYDLVVVATLDGYRGHKERILSEMVTGSKTPTSRLRPEHRLRPRRISYASPLELSVVVPSAVVLAATVPYITRSAAQCFADVIDILFRLPARVRIGRMSDRAVEKRLSGILHDEQAGVELAHILRHTQASPIKLVDAQQDGRPLPPAPSLDQLHPFGVEELLYDEDDGTDAEADCEEDGDGW